VTEPAGRNPIVRWKARQEFNIKDSGMENQFKRKLYLDITCRKSWKCSTKN